MTDLAGQTLGKYQLLERLGRGGMADVYKGYQPGLDRYVAVKVLHAHLAEDPGFITRFKREARSVAELRHPHIVQVFDFDVQADNYYMVMEYVEGGKTLKELLQSLAAKGERLPLDKTLEIVSKLADALAYAHGLGMIHRDIKPANVLIPTLDRPVLSDFGIARLLGETGLTSSGAMVGTPAYMSPEQGKGERGDARSDIYALGIVLYEMLTGRPPYDADTPYAVILKHINDPLVPPRALISTLPDAVERVVLRCLAKSPGDRFAAMAELRDALRSAQTAISAPAGRHTLPVSAPPTVEVKPPPAAPTVARQPESPPTPQYPLPLQPSKRPMWIAAAVAAVILVGAVIVFALRGQGPAPEASPAATLAAVASPGTPAPPAAPTEAQVQVDAGYEQFFANNTDAALARFNRALEIQPGYPPALVGRAIGELDRYGNMDQAAGDLSRAAPAMNADPLWHFGMGMLHIRSEKGYDPKVAESDFTYVIGNCGDRVNLCVAAYVLRADTRTWHLNDMKGGLADLDGAIERHPDPDPDYLFSIRADLRWHAGDANGAMGDLETAYNISKSGEHLERAAAVAVHAENFDRALGYYDRLLTEQAGNPHYLVGRGFVEWRSGDPDKAMQTARRAIELSDAIEGHYLLGLLLLELGQPQDALAELRRVAPTDPDTLNQAGFPFLVKDFGYEIFYDLARAAHAAGDPNAALGFIEQSLKRDEGWPFPYIERGKILAERKDLAGARESYLKALDSASDDPRLQALINELLAGLSQ